MTSLSTAPAPIPSTQPLISRRTTATVVGVLFVVQMVTAMVGTSMIEAFVDGGTDRGSMTVGVLLMMGSGLAVVGIGLLMYPVLKEVNPRLAVWYPVLRITECLVSAACGVYLLVESQVVPNHMLWIYVPTGWAASSSPTSSSSRAWSRGPSPSWVSWGTACSPSEYPSTSSASST